MKIIDANKAERHPWESAAYNFVHITSIPRKTVSVVMPHNAILNRLPRRAPVIVLLKGDFSKAVDVHARQQKSFDMLLSGCR